MMGSRCPWEILNALIQKGLRRLFFLKETYGYEILNALIQKGLRQQTIHHRRAGQEILNALIQKGLRQCRFLPALLSFLKY